MSLGSYTFDNSGILQETLFDRSLRSKSIIGAPRLKAYLAVVLVFIMVSTSFTIIDFSSGHGSSSQSSITLYSQTSAPSFYPNQPDKPTGGARAFHHV